MAGAPQFREFWQARACCVILLGMKLRRLVLAVFIFGISAAAQTAAPADLSANIDQMVADAMHKQQIPTMTVAMATGTRISYSRAFGTADLENGIQATTETL